MISCSSVYAAYIIEQTPPPQQALRSGCCRSCSFSLVLDLGPLTVLAIKLNPVWTRHRRLTSNRSMNMPVSSVTGRESRKSAISMNDLL